jgi:hypothetical protein
VTDTATLVINGSWGASVSVDSGATLSGTGAISGGFTQVNGSLTVGGDGIGLLTANNVGLGSTSQITMQIAGAGTAGVDYDSLAANNALTLDGALVLNITTGLAGGDVLDLFSAFTSESGQFAGVSATGIYNFSFTYDGSDVWSYQDVADGLIFNFSQSTGDLSIVAIPEPSSTALLLGGVLGLALWAKARRRSATVS